MGNDIAKAAKERNENNERREYLAQLQRQASRNATASAAQTPQVPRSTNPPHSARPNTFEQVVGHVVQPERVEIQSATSHNQLRADEIIRKCNDLQQKIYPNLQNQEENMNQGNAARAKSNDLQFYDVYPNRNKTQENKYTRQNQDLSERPRNDLDYFRQPSVKKERSPMQYEGKWKSDNSAMTNTPSTSAGSARHGCGDFVMVDNYYSTDSNKYPPSALPEMNLTAPAPARRNKPFNRRQKSPQSEMCCETCNREFGVEQIFQCNSGHSACERCKHNGLRCGRCNTNILDMRNFAIEEHVRDCKIPCPNKADGCSFNLRRVDMDIHLTECIYREMDCPATVFGLCTWKGMRGVEMLRHFDEYHQDHRQGGVDQEMSLRCIENDNRILYLVPIGGYLFLYHVRISRLDQTLSMAVQLIGTKTQANKWTYKIDIYNKSEPRRKIEYVDTCLPDSDDIKDVFRESRCLVLPLAYMRSYLSREGLLYKFYITRPDEDGPRRTRQPFRGGRGGKRGTSR